MQFHLSIQTITRGHNSERTAPRFAPWRPRNSLHRLQKLSAVNDTTRTELSKDTPRCELLTRPRSRPSTSRNIHTIHLGSPITASSAKIRRIRGLTPGLERNVT